MDYSTSHLNLNTTPAPNVTTTTPPPNPPHFDALKCALLVALLVICFVFSMIPFTLRKMATQAQPETRRRTFALVFTLLSCYGGGVFLGTCLLDLLPDAITSVRTVIPRDRFPLAEFLVTMGFFAVLFLEQLVMWMKEEGYLGGGRANETPEATTGSTTAVGPSVDVAASITNQTIRRRSTQYSGNLPTLTSRDAHLYDSDAASSCIVNDVASMLTHTDDVDSSLVPSDPRVSVVEVEDATNTPHLCHAPDCNGNGTTANPVQDKDFVDRSTSPKPGPSTGDRTTTHQRARRSVTITSSVRAGSRDGSLSPRTQTRMSHRSAHGHGHSHDAHFNPGSHSTVRAMLLVCALSMHAVFEGLALGMARTVSSAMQLFAALSIHKSLIAFSVGLRLVQSRLQFLGVFLSCLTFCVMAPIGGFVGVAVMQTVQGNTATLLSGCLTSVACGTFLYVTCFEILPHELNEPNNRLAKLCMLVLGFITICLFVIVFG